MNKQAPKHSVKQPRKIASPCKTIKRKIKTVTKTRKSITLNNPSINTTSPIKNKPFATLVTRHVASETLTEEDFDYTPLFPRNPKPLFLVCDIQETFRPTMHHFPRLVASSELLLNFALEMDYDVRVSEQIPFRGTIYELDNILKTFAPEKIRLYKKSTFSMIPDIVDVNWEDYNAVVLFGIESHVCILQTYQDLVQTLPSHVPVYVVKDATFSQRNYDRSAALTQMVDAIQVTSEALCYGFMRTAKHPKFKAVLPHVKAHASVIREQDLDGIPSA